MSNMPAAAPGTAVNIHARIAQSRLVRLRLLAGTMALFAVTLVIGRQELALQLILLWHLRNDHDGAWIVLVLIATGVNLHDLLIIHIGIAPQRVYEDF